MATETLNIPVSPENFELEYMRIRLLGKVADSELKVLIALNKSRELPEIAELAGMELRTLRNYLTRLKRKKLVVQIKGVYRTPFKVPKPGAAQIVVNLTLKENS